MNRLIVILFIAAAAWSCSNKRHDEKLKQAPGIAQMADINRQLLIKDRERILSYIERKGLDMAETSSGLWISSVFAGNKGIKEGSTVKLEYKCSLLDGTRLYDSASDGIMTFTIGRSDVPAGLNEGVKMLEKGDSAVMILPNHLAYGLLGDDNKVPARSVLVYGIKVIEAY